MAGRSIPYIPEALDILTELLAVRLGGRNPYSAVTPFGQGANWQHGVNRPSKPVSRVTGLTESQIQAIAKISSVQKLVNLSPTEKNLQHYPLSRLNNSVKVLDTGINAEYNPKQIFYNSSRKAIL